MPPRRCASPRRPSRCSSSSWRTRRASRCSTGLCMACVRLPQAWPSSTPPRQSRRGCVSSATTSMPSRACAKAASSSGPSRRRSISRRACLPASSEEFPDVDMRLIVGNRAETIASLRDHQVDIALMGRPPRDIPVRAAVFGDHPLVIVVAPDHPLARKRDISKEQVARRALHHPRARIRHADFVRTVPRRHSRAGSTIPERKWIPTRRSSRR